MNYGDVIFFFILGVLYGNIIINILCNVFNVKKKIMFL